MDGTLPISIAQLQEIFKNLSQLDGTVGSPYEQREPEEAASIVDLTHLLDKLVSHYNGATDSSLGSDLSFDDSNLLEDIFFRMTKYYEIEQALQRGHAEELWTIFDDLADIYGFALFDADEDNDDFDEDEDDEDEDEDDDEDDEDERWHGGINDMVDELEMFDMGGEGITQNLLVTIFHDLLEHYKEDNTDANEEISEVRIADLADVFNHLAKLDGTLGSPFEQRDDDDIATI